MSVLASAMNKQVHVTSNYHIINPWLKHTIKTINLKCSTNSFNNYLFFQTHLCTKQAHVAFLLRSTAKENMIPNTKWEQGIVETIRNFFSEHVNVRHRKIKQDFSGNPKIETFMQLSVGLEQPRSAFKNISWFM